jgi:hypothetical protein
VLIAPDLALTAGHCARGAVSGPAAMRLIFRPYDTPPAFQVTVRAVAFHEQNTAPGLDADERPCRCRAAPACHAGARRGRRAHPAGQRTAASGRRVRLWLCNGDDDHAPRPSESAVESARPQLLVSDCTVVSGFSGAPLLSGGPATGASKASPSPPSSASPFAR